jgi:hypothetical protein
MSPRKKEPKIVAELGRPETPEETATRKAANSRKYRESKTLNNLIYSMIVTLGLVAVIYFLVPRPDQEPKWNVDYVAASQEASDTLGYEVLVPALPETWRANAAEIRNISNGQVTSWYIGFITPENQFIAYNEAVNADATWISQLLKDFPSTGEVSIDGQQWTIYDNRSMEDAGNAAYAMVTTFGEITIVLHGTASDAEFALLASSITADLVQPTP